MLKGIDHVAVAVADLDDIISTFKTVFGVEVEHRETIEAYKVEVATLNLGNTCIEFVQGTSDDSPIRKYVENKGTGIHHLAFNVDDVEAAIVALTAAGADVIDRTPRPGKDGSLVAFVHPKSTGNVLCELVQNRPRPGEEKP